MRKGSGVFLVALGLAASAVAYPLTMEQRERLKSGIPRTFLKLEAQRPVHIVTLGDSVTWHFTRDDQSGNWLHSYAGYFGEQLARQFFYTGGVRALNPETSFPAKLKDHEGREIYLENLAVPGRCALDALQRISTDAFLGDPDLVTVSFGINDSTRGHSMDYYRRSIQAVVDACRERGVDLVVLGPSITRASPGPTGWGLERPYALVAREVAARNEVPFVDIGMILSRLGGGVPAGAEPEAALLTVAERLSRIFEFDPPPDIPDVLHPNTAAHQVMGRGIFDVLLNGPVVDETYSLSGSGHLEGNDQVKMRLTLRNLTDQPKNGYLAALSMGRSLTPAEPYRAFSIRAGGREEIEFIYERAASERSAGGRTPFEINDPFLRMSYLVVDEASSRLLDVVTRPEPVAVAWTTQSFRSLGDSLRLEWNFVNGSSDPIRGRYRVGMGENASGWVAFDLEAVGVKKFEATFPFKPPPGAARFKAPVFVDVEVDGRAVTFPRELEASRDLALRQGVALARHSDYGATEIGQAGGAAELDAGESGIVLRIDADEDYLYVIFDLEDLPLAATKDDISLQAEISLDARPVEKVGTFGFVDRLRIFTGAEDGPGRVQRPALGAFGEGYDMILPEEGFSAVLSTRGAGGRRLVAGIPFSYLFRYDRQLGSPDAVMGLNVNVFVSETDPETGNAAFPADRRFVLTLPQGGAEQALYFRDPRGFATLRLVPGPVSTWSASLY